MKSNPPINVLPEKTLREVERGERKVQLIYRDKLAERLGVSPKERLSLTVLGKPINGKVLLLVSALIDGGDLTSGQETVFKAYLVEVGVETLGIVPELPTTS